MSRNFTSKVKISIKGNHYFNNYNTGSGQNHEDMAFPIKPGMTLLLAVQGFYFCIAGEEKHQNCRN